MAQHDEPLTGWTLPLASPVVMTGLRVAVPLRLHPTAGAAATLLLAMTGIDELIFSTWAHTQEHGGTAEVFCFAGGVVIRWVQSPVVPFHSVASVQEFAVVHGCPGLYLPVGMVIRPMIRPASWPNLRVPNSMHLFVGDNWLSLPFKGFRPLAGLVNVDAPRSQVTDQVWLKSAKFNEDIKQVENPSVAKDIRPTRSTVTKSKASLTQQLRQFFSHKEKDSQSTPQVVAEKQSRIKHAQRTQVPIAVIKALLRRQELSLSHEITAWQTVAHVDSEQNEQLADLARSHVAWLQKDSEYHHGLGVRATWLTALSEANQRGGDSLHLATVYDQLLQQMEAGLHRVHDLPSFLWAGSRDSGQFLLELHESFLKHCPATGVGTAFAVLLFAAAAQRCNESSLASRWLDDVHEKMMFERPTRAAQSVARLCDVVRSELRVRTMKAQKSLGKLDCPNMTILTRRCHMFMPYLLRLPKTDPEWELFAGNVHGVSAKVLLHQAEQERTAFTLPRNVFVLGASDLCQSRKDVQRWVQLVPDAIELQSEFWRARWPDESQLFDVQVRWCDRLLRWAFDGLQEYNLDPTDFLRAMFSQAKERDTPLRIALANCEWHVQRCFKENKNEQEQKSWLKLGLLSSASTMLLRGKLKDANKTLDELAKLLIEAPLQTSSTSQALSLLLSACFVLPESQAQERGRTLTKIMAQRLAEQGDHDAFAWKNLVSLDQLLSTFFGTLPPNDDTLLAWLEDDEQRIRKRMARDLAAVLSDIS